MLKKFKGPITVLCFFLCFAVGLIIGDGRWYKAGAAGTDIYKKLDIFADVLEIVKNNYVEEPDTQKLIYGAIQGMLESLDPHSSFMTPEFYQEMQIETRGSFGGLGIEITVKDGVLTVVSPIEDTPAYRGGLMAGDQILKINNQPTKGMSLMEAVQKLRGKPKTSVTISIWRQGFERLKDITLVREIIKLKSVKYRVLEPGYGYVRIAQFQEQTTEEFRKALDELEKNKLEGLILDLRNDPGGLLEHAVNVSDEFIDTGLIVYTDGRLESQRYKFPAHKSDKKRDYPIVVLINGGSASASEIVAGALQDHHRAIVLGTQSFGKGTVQSIIQLNDGSAVRLTTAKYYTPNGTSIQAKGITPDIVVNPEIVIKKAVPELPFKEEDLKNHFLPEGGEAPKKPQPQPEIKKDETKPPTEGQAAKAEETDTQLERALELLKGWKIFRENWLQHVKAAGAGK